MNNHSIKELEEINNKDKKHKNKRKNRKKKMNRTKYMHNIFNFQKNI